ncbi:MAG: hypothetical protein GY758_13580 [Fuerstiella sp.]|nr:hypothetical protein [Fuerstiella sp.]MCP4787194.1 hypothetical protein [Fuerstiella sp.]MCP4855210.1 hypothetical protein [Fuerstiella sp.]
MNLLSKIWRDEAGLLLSAEAAIVGTVAVVGISSGLSVVATSVNEELKEVGDAIRSLDQSYQIPARTSCTGAMTAGSVFEQTPVDQLLAEPDEAERTAEQEAEEQAQKVENKRVPGAPQAERLKRQIQQQQKARDSAPPQQKPRKI